MNLLFFNNNKILLFFTTFILIFLCLIPLTISIDPRENGLLPNKNGIFIVNITAHNNDVIAEPTCSLAKPCYDGVLIPAWRPLDIPECTRWFRAFIYLLALGYLFYGVSIVADRFMAAIEVITSQEKVVKLRKPNGEEYTVLVRVWNETVSNLTLMALGSSAPEILLSVIEIFGNNFEAGELGPGTIVGSAAFNLFVIVAICIYVIPVPEIRRIYRYDVFWVTVIWSSFAYVWLYLILAVFSPNVVEVWEGVLTFLFFPLTVMSAYFANLYTHNFGQRILAMPMASFVRRSPTRTPNKELNNDVEKGENLNVALMGNRSAKKESVAFDNHKKRYLEIFRQLRTQNPDMTIDELEVLATDQIVKEAPKSRAFYRIQATHKMMGAGDLTLKAEKQLLRKKSNQSQNSFMPEKPKMVTVQFDPSNYMCLENCGTIKLNVKCDRGSLEVPTRVSVHYKTIADTAQEDDDFIPAEGDLIFKPGENIQHIEVGIVDNDVYEEDEQFHVRLSDVRAVCDTNEQQTIRAEIGANSLATVLIIDDDHGGAFTFDNEYYKVPENQGVFILEVTRHRGARGKVSIPYRTIDGAAKNGEDYVGHDGNLVFEDGQTKALIEIEIINDDEYEKSEDFYVELAEPSWVTDHGLGQDGADGRPILGAHTRCRIDIIEDVEFKGFVDRLVANANVSLMVGTHSWRQQFRDAFTVEDLDDDGELSKKEKVLHYISFPWKLVFALIPPTDYFSGWLSFFVSIFAIGVVTAVIGDVASHLGCTIGLKDSITAITLVALGTSLPDTFASKTAALQDKTADASIGNVTGSNAVNVFLGIGIAWAIAAIYHSMNGTVFRVEAGTLASSVTLFLLGSIVCFGVLVWRRYNPQVLAELGGPPRQKYISVGIFLTVWFIYVIYSICVAYCILPGF